MTTINKITLAIIVVLTIIFAITIGTLNTKINTVTPYATSTLDISSSTIQVNNGTTTVDVPTVNILQYMSAEMYCIKNPTVEGCVAPAAMTSASSSSL